MSKRRKRKASFDLFCATGFALCVMGAATVAAVELTRPAAHTGQRIVRQVAAKEPPAAEPGEVVLWKHAPAEDPHDWAADLERSMHLICEVKPCEVRNGQLTVVAQADTKAKDRPYGARN